MDFDLFETEQDDDILLSVPMEPTVTLKEIDMNGIIPELQCHGEDFIDSKFSDDGFIKNKFLNWYIDDTSKQCIETISITDHKLGWEELNSKSLLDFAFSNCCINIQFLLTNAKHALLDIQQQKSKIYYQKRREITLLYHLVLHKLLPQQWSVVRSWLENVRALIKSITIQKQIWKTLCKAYNGNGNECNVASYHLLHGILEWEFLDLCILHKYEWTTNEMVGCDSVRKCDTKKTESFFNVIIYMESFLEDLIISSLCLYEKKNSTTLLESSPFLCTCVKEMWLLLQLALKKWSLTNFVELGNEKITFWMLFNKLMEKIKNNYDNVFITQIPYTEFSNWLLQGLVRLHGYRSDGQYEGPSYALTAVEKHVENLQFCEKITQQFLQANPNEQQLRVYIILLTPILLEWWKPKINIPVLLWEYYHKKLNRSFYVMNSAPSNLAVTCPSGRSYVNKYRTLLNKPLDINVNSYTLFTMLLGKCMERFLKYHESHQAQKLLGRIYSKFSVQKFFTLNETGLHHLIELFIVLALCGDFNNIAPKLRDKLLAIQLNNVTATKQIIITKGHMALCILFAEKQYDLTEYLTKLFRQLAAVNNDLTVSKIIADTMLDIYKQSCNFSCGEHLFVGPWLAHFLYNCAPIEQERILEALHLMFERLKIMDGLLDSSTNLMKALNDTILPFIKEQYVVNRSHWLPKLAANFCTQPFLVSTDTHNFQKLFSYFIEAHTVEHRNTLRFLLQIVNSERKISIDPSIIIHIWLKSLVLLGNANEEVDSLTKIVTELDDFHYMTNLNSGDLLSAKEPLCNFIAAVGKTYVNCCALNNIPKRTRMAHNLNLYWRNFDKWLPETFHTMKITEMEKTDFISRFYSFIAIVIYNCAEVAYTKSKISCFFHVAMTRYILPINIQIGKAPDGKIAHVVHKIWPVVMQGIGRLDFKRDAYLEKTIIDLIKKWVPHFKISPNPKIVARPFIQLLNGENQDLSLFVVQKIAQLFLSTQRRQADQYACLVITILHEVLEATSVVCQSENETHHMAEQRLLTFVKGISIICLEHIMMVDEFVPSRTLLLDLYRNLLNNPVYRKSTALKELITEHLRLLAKKHLAYYTFFYFNLLMKLSSIQFELVATIMDFLSAEIHIVEQKRGVDKDNRIRECLQKLEESLNVAKVKKKTNI